MPRSALTFSWEQNWQELTTLRVPSIFHAISFHFIPLHEANPYLQLQLLGGGRRGLLFRPQVLNEHFEDVQDLLDLNR